MLPTFEFDNMQVTCNVHRSVEFILLHFEAKKMDALKIFIFNLFIPYHVALLFKKNEFMDCK